MAQAAKMQFATTVRQGALLLHLFFYGCSGAPHPAENNAPDSACLAHINPSPGAVTDPGGPYYHQVVIGTTSNGTTITNAHQVLDHASVPDGVRLNDGRVLVYYVNGARGAVWVAQIEGDSARPLSGIAIDGISEPAGVVDPDASVGANGNVRLFYLSGFGPPGTGTGRAICLAESSDGIHFVTAGTALPMANTELLTDPSVVRLPDGSYRMAISLGQRTVFAMSSDGIRFTRLGALNYGGVPELALTNSGQLRLYVCAQGIVSYVSGDAGSSWAREATVIAPPASGPRIVCDPSMVAGTTTFIYKTAP